MKLEVKVSILFTFDIAMSTHSNQLNSLESMTLLATLTLLLIGRLFPIQNFDLFVILVFSFSKFISDSN